MRDRRRFFFRTASDAFNQIYLIASIWIHCCVPGRISALNSIPYVRTLRRRPSSLRISRMSFQLPNQRNEKITFLAVIGVLLFSLLYISGYSLRMQEEMNGFRQEMNTINDEMDIILEFIPEKDSTIWSQTQQLILQVNEINRVLAQNDISRHDQEALGGKLLQLRNQMQSLKEQLPASQLARLAHVSETTPKVSYRQIRNGDMLLATREREIARLQQVIEQLEARSPRVIVHNKVAVYYFVALSSDRKNRANRTHFLSVQLQLKGDVSTLSNQSLRIEIRDPQGLIISTARDQVKASSYYQTGCQFKPMFRYKFIRGKYTIRIYSEGNEFQAVTFLNLA